MTLCLLTLLPQRAIAQDETYRFDLGGGLGMSGYLGDLNDSHLFDRPGLAANAAWRYRPDARWAFKTSLGYTGLNGNSASLASALPGGKEYSFRSTVFDLSESAEFNFMPYGIGETYKHLRRFSPYVSLGLGFAVASCGEATAAALTIPMGLGIKYKLRPRLNLSAEFSMTKALTDRLDGDITDLYGVKSSMVKNTDWYSRLVLSVSYEFGERCPTCHYYD